MFKLKKVSKKSLIVAMIALIPLLFAGCNWLWGWTELYVNRQSSATEQNFLSAKDVYICQGESALLRWDSDRKFSERRITPDVGQVNKSGQRTITPTETTEYTLIAEKDNHHSSSRAKVHIIQPGDEVTIEAEEIYDSERGSYYWQKKTREQIFSPNIVVNAISSVYGANEVGPWNLNKIDKNGVSHSLDIPENKWVTPEPRFSVIGTWNFDPEQNYDGEASFKLRLQCETG